MRIVTSKDLKPVTKADRLFEKLITPKITRCPRCHTKLDTVHNTFGGLPYITVVYCPKCSWTNDYEQI